MSLLDPSPLRLVYTDPRGSTARKFAIAGGAGSVPQSGDAAPDGPTCAIEKDDDEPDAQLLKKTSPRALTARLGLFQFPERWHSGAQLLLV